MHVRCTALVQQFLLAAPEPHGTTESDVARAFRCHATVPLPVLLALRVTLQKVLQRTAKSASHPPDVATRTRRALPSGC
jgi:hypothetical protein